jgi:hypothetical protein
VEEMDLLATSCSPSLLLNNMETYICRMQHWLWDWRISINVSKITAMLFTTRRIQRPRPIQFLGGPIACVERARYVGVILDTRFTR